MPLQYLSEMAVHSGSAEHACSASSRVTSASLCGKKLRQ